MSFLPGLGLTAPTALPTAEADSVERTITLSAGSEWRFEVPSTSSLSVKLLTSGEAPPPAGTNPSDSYGTAEVFGTELAPSTIYEFAPLTKAAVYTHHGCSLSVTGSCDTDYIANETPMTEYTNLHFALENLRNNARQDDGGPRVLVVGPKDSGKTTLVKTLTSYAIRMGRSPVVVNLDPAEGMLALPGSMSVAVFGTGAILEVEDAGSAGWGTSPIGGPSPTPVKTPLVYHYGVSAAAEERPELFRPVTTRLALAATSRFEEDSEVKRSGMIIDVGGSICGGKAGYEVLSHIVSEFSINIIVSLGSERLYNDMQKRFGTPNPTPDDEPVQVVRLTRSGGCVDRDESYMRQLRQAQIRNYFFGGPKNTLSPFTIGAEFDAFKMLRFMEAKSDAMNESFLPGDEGLLGSSSSSNAIFEIVSPSIAMHNALLTIKHAPSNASQEAVRDAPIVGYLYVADVDEQKKRLRILSPVGGRLPSGAIVWGNWDGALAVGMAGLLGG